MCVDYTNLNKHFPKDSYPLPYIDKLVDESSGYRYLRFIDAYSWYNPIPWHLNDQKKTAFMMEKENYYYKVMSFGLKNVEATYERMMKKVFEK